jgi:hypothetical protein
LAAATKPAPCQVRNQTGNPCPRRAEVEILGVAFCGPCAREQEAYFAIGELVDEEAQDFRGEALAEALERVRAGSTADITARLHHGLSDAQLLAQVPSLCEQPPVGMLPREGEASVRRYLAPRERRDHRP